MQTNFPPTSAGTTSKSHKIRTEKRTKFTLKINPSFSKG